MMQMKLAEYNTSTLGCSTQKAASAKYFAPSFWMQVSKGSTVKDDEYFEASTVSHIYEKELVRKLYSVSIMESSGNVRAARKLLFTEIESSFKKGDLIRVNFFINKICQSNILNENKISVLRASNRARKYLANWSELAGRAVEKAKQDGDFDLLIGFD